MKAARRDVLASLNPRLADELNPENVTTRKKVATTRWGSQTARKETMKLETFLNGWAALKAATEKTRKKIEFSKLRASKG